MIKTCILLFFICSWIFFSGGSSSEENSLTVYNRSQKDIEHGSVSICKNGKSYGFSNLKTDDKKVINFKPVGDCSYYFKIEFDDNTTLVKDNIGYITNGLITHDVYGIFDDEIKSLPTHCEK